MFPIKRVGNKSYNVKVYIFLNYAYRLAKHSFKDHVDMQGDTSFHLRYCCDDLGIVDCRTINNEAILKAVSFKFELEISNIHKICTKFTQSIK